MARYSVQKTSLCGVIADDVRCGNCKGRQSRGFRSLRTRRRVRLCHTLASPWTVRSRCLQRCGFGTPVAIKHTKPPGSREIDRKMVDFFVLKNLD